MKKWTLLGVSAAVALSAAAFGQEAADSCASAPVVGYGTFSWDLVGKTNDASVTCGASTTGPDVWLDFLSPADGEVTVSTCGLTTFDSVLAVFDACAGTQLLCLDDFCGLQTQITINATTGTHYLIRIAQYFNGDTGSGQVTISGPVGPPANDACGSATAVGEGTFDWDLRGASNDGPATCGGSGTNPDVWFAYTPSADGIAEFSTCGLTTFDSVLAVFDACGGTQLFCLDDACGLQTSFTLPVVATSTYLVRVAQFGLGRNGFGQMAINLCTANYMPPDSGTAEGENCLVDEEADILNGGCNSTPNVFGAIGCGETILGTSSGYTFNNQAFRDTDWFRFTLAADDTVTLSGQAQFTCQVFILPDACPATILAGPANNSACNADFSLSTFLTAGSYIAFISPTTFGPGTVVCGQNSSYWMNLAFGAGCGGASCDPDVNCDGSPDQGDVACMILAVAGETGCICQDPDFNQDGSADQGDVAAVISTVAGQPCP